MAQLNDLVVTGSSRFLNKINGTCTDGSAGTTKYLRQDGTWQVPPNDNTTYTLDVNGNNIRLKNQGGTVISTVTAPYATSAGSATSATSATTASKATAANLTTTQYGIAHYTNTTGTFGNNPCLITTSTGGLEVKGTIAGDSGSTGHGLWSGGGYHNAYNNIILHGDTSTGSSGIAFVSDKITASTGAVTNINQPSDRAFIQYHACGVTTATAENVAPTIATSGEAGKLVIGIGNDVDDQVWLQTPSRTGLIHQVGASSYTIPDTGNTTGNVGSGTQPVYVSGGVITNTTYTLAKSVPADAVFTDHYAWTDITGKPSSYTPSSGSLYYIMATRGSSKSTASNGFWAAMCNTNSTGSPTLPTSGKWWHVLSMDWDGNDVNNWYSQLALPTQDGNSLYYRHNSTGASKSSIDNAPWVKVLDEKNYTDYTVTKTGTGASGTWGININGNSYEEKLLWGGGNIVASVSPIGMALSNEHSANRLAFINGDCITLEYSSNGGSSYTDYGWSATDKSRICTGSQGVPIGRASASTEITTSSRTRLTITAQNGTTGYVYTNPKKMLINVATAGQLQVLIEYRTGANYKSGGAWSTFGTYSLSGWSGWNDIPLILNTLGGGTNQTGNIWQLRLTFIVVTVNESYKTTCQVNSIRIYGDNGWSTPSNMAATGHIYSYDMSQNATFPANVTATKFVGPLQGNANTATTASQLNGFTAQSSQTWGNQTGTFVHAENDSTGGSIAFRRDNPSSGQLSMILDGTVYIKEGAVNISDAVKSFSVNGTTVTYTTLWGGTGTFTTSDHTYNFGGTTFYSGNSGSAEHNADNILYNGHYYYTSNGPATSLGASTTDGAIYAQAYSTAWVGQIAQDYRDGSLFVRGKNNGTWQKWLAVLDSGNIGYNMTSTVNYDPHTRKFITSKSTSAWDAQAYSNSGYVDNVFVTFKPNQTNMALMVGLDSNPSQDASYGNIDYCWYCHNDGKLTMFESGTEISSVTGHTTYAAGDEFRVEYTGEYVKYYHNSTICRQIARSVSGKLYLDSSFHGASSCIYDVEFGAGSKNATWALAADNATNANTANNAATATTALIAAKVTATTTNPSSAATYYIPFAAGDGNQPILGNNGLRYYTKEGTTSAAGWGELVLGNSTSTGTAGNKSGWLKLFSEKNGQAELAYTASATGNTTHYLPDVGGTLLNTGNYMNYLIPGNANVTVDSKTSSTTSAILITDVSKTNAYGFVSAGTYHVAFKCYNGSVTAKCTDSAKLEVKKTQNYLLLYNATGTAAIYIMITS